MCDVRMERARLGYTKLKDEQLRTVTDVLSGLDTFVSLPTGYASRCVTPFYRGLLMNFGTPRKQASKQVSPLVSLTTD